MTRRGQSMRGGVLRRALALAVAVGALTGCPLRPRYAEFLGADSTAPVKLQVVERRSGLPVPDARVEVGEAKGRVSVTTDAEGCFTLPVDKRLLEDNALVVVSAPKGVGRTAVVAPGSWSGPVEAPRSAPPPAEAAEGSDAGS